MTTTRKVETYWLARGSVSYRFTAQGDNVTVARVQGSRRQFYTLPTDEARHLWTSLTHQGYTKF